MHLGMLYMIVNSHEVTIIQPTNPTIYELHMKFDNAICPRPKYGFVLKAA
jgi:hypothetical protein